MKIGIVGAGRIGGTLTRRWTALGHHVSVANSRDPATLSDLAEETGAVSGVRRPGGGRCRRRGGDRAAPGRARPPRRSARRCRRRRRRHRHLQLLPPPARDGRIAEIEDGLPESRWVERQLGVSVVKAFNGIYAERLLTLGRPGGADDRIALPVAGDDADARSVVMGLVDELGFDPVAGLPAAATTRGASSPGPRCTAPTSTSTGYAGRSPPPCRSGTRTGGRERVRRGGGGSRPPGPARHRGRRHLGRGGHRRRTARVRTWPSTPSPAATGPRSSWRRSWSAGSAPAGRACRARPSCGPSRSWTRPGRCRCAARSPAWLDVEAVLDRRDGFTSHHDDSSQVSWAEGVGIDVVRGSGRLSGSGP